jgi:hypothetical protein
MESTPPSKSALAPLGPVYCGETPSLAVARGWTMAVEGKGAEAVEGRGRNGVWGDPRCNRRSAAVLRRSAPLAT